MGVLYVLVSDIQQIKVWPYFTMKLIFPLAVVLLVFASCSEGGDFNCYNCIGSSLTDDWCLDGNFDGHENAQLDCSLFNHCSKSSWEVGDTEFVTRSCGVAGGTDDDCTTVKDDDGNEVTVCVCDSNLCNTAQSFGLNINLGVITT